MNLRLSPGSICRPAAKLVGFATRRLARFTAPAYRYELIEFGDDNRVWQPALVPIDRAVPQPREAHSNRSFGL